MKIHVNPVPAPRMSRYDRWTNVEKGKGRPAVLRYFRYRDALKEAYGDSGLPPELHLQFVIPMPPSWSRKKKLLYDGKPHQQRPDTDNLIKAVQDALAKEDGYIYHVDAMKHWGATGSVTIEPIHQGP